jgi:NAD(P)-dependent dehydrogenase (short-subunit alcohol dehydrogenase family)
MDRLHNKVAVITGGTTGIGLATAKRFLAEGARLVVTGRNDQTLAEARKELPSEVEVFKADTSRLEDIDRLVERVKTLHGGVDVLFVNAGIAKFQPFDQVSEALWEETMGVNLKGAFFTVQKFSPLLREGASVIFNTSVVDRVGMNMAAIYSASKAGLRSLSQTLATELVGRKIRVNAIAPGPIATPIYGKLDMPKETVDAFAHDILGKVPMQRFGQPEEIAGVAAFLASQDSSFITGEEILVDGGYLLN